jgi:glycosyltransferase involved in cell wall biosynthesis
VANDPGPGVLHVDSERTWRGGQQQVFWLLEGMAARGSRAALACPPGSVLEERAGTAGLPVLPVTMRGEWDLGAARRIAALARAGGFRVLHAHSGHALAICLWAGLAAPGLRVVASRRVDFPLARNPLSRLKYTTRRLERIVCISEAVRAVLVASGVPPRKLAVIRSGVDTRRFEGVRPPPNFRRRLGIPNGHLVVGTVAALADHKDYPSLLRAARLVLAREPDVTFVAVGDGPLRAPLLALARELELGRRFLFTGFREDVGSFLRIFDVFALASKLEGMGTSVLDAQAAGLPIVACRAGGIPEIVTDRESGLLVPPGDPEALALAIVELAHQPELRRALGERARRSVREHDVSRTVEEHIKLYAELVS